MCSNMLSSLKVLFACIIDWKGLANFLMATCEFASISTAELWDKTVYRYDTGRLVTGNQQLNRTFNMRNSVITSSA